ncbi:MAG: ribose-phosphate pyrophosphokinase [Legionellales bacterium]|jgi:ribose-phosphate pyrophosphokinase
MNTPPLLFSLFDDTDFALAIQKILNCDIGKINIHTFPDKETLVRFDSSLENREIIFIASLDNPNTKLMPLLFASETARALGATKIGLIAPYLAYMRQDKIFHPGEGVTSQYFAKLISDYFDWLVTIDPHLHRWHTLADIYSIPTQVLHAAPCIADWIKTHTEKPLLIGPDSESEQWVGEIANLSNAPYVICNKHRESDNHVNINIPQIDLYSDHTPILIDDIISTATTMIETVKHLQLLKLKSPICIGVHPIFADQAYKNLLHANVSQIVSCNTIKHPSNRIDVSSLFSTIKS